MEGMRVQEAELLTLQDMKGNLRIDADDVDEVRDDNLMACAAAAEQMVLNYCNTSWNEIYDDYGKVPAPIARAMLAIACGLYQEPTGVSARQMYVVPFHVQACLTSYIKLTNRVAP